MLTDINDDGRLDAFSGAYSQSRGMFDKFLVRDMDGDGDADLIGTRGSSIPYDGVFWLEQVRRAEPVPAFD